MPDSYAVPRCRGVKAVRRPIMQDLTKDIIDGLSDGRPHVREYFQEITLKLEAFGFKDPDTEAIMDVLTARQDPNRARLTIGPRIVEFADKLPIGQPT